MKTPDSERLHIAVIGKRNSGKSSLVNALAGQTVSIVSNVPGTTTDPVSKAMEVPGAGPCVFIDTAGFDDDGTLGDMRTGRTMKAMEKADMAIFMFRCPEDNASNGNPDRTDSRAVVCPGGGNSPTDIADSRTQKWLDILKSENIPIIPVLNVSLAAIMRTDCYSTGTPDTDSADDSNGSHDGIRHSRTGNATTGNTGAAEGRTEAPGTLKDREALIADLTGKRPVIIDAASGKGIRGVFDAIIENIPEHSVRPTITGSLAKPGDTVMLVMPQDSQAPTGRLILPQVQTIRELLDKGCSTICCTPDKMQETLLKLSGSPDLIITDSQAFQKVWDARPEGCPVTSFSILFAGYKGDIRTFLSGAETLDRLDGQAHILIAEACTHAPASEDIGRVKIPEMLRKRLGEGIRIDTVAGNDFPDDLTGYDLIIHCGACMFNKKHVLNRIETARRQNVPITNYGMAIAWAAGILNKTALP